MSKMIKKTSRDRGRWLSVDWSKSDAQIAKQLDVTSETVFYHRKKHTDYQPQQRIMIDWESVDILEPAKDVADKLGITEKQVRKRRYYMRLHQNKKALEDKSNRWSAVNWSKSVADIASDLGVSKQAVYNRKNKILSQRDSND